jgi:hypothetical protein
MTRCRFLLIVTAPLAAIGLLFIAAVYGTRGR